MHAKPFHAKINKHTICYKILLDTMLRHREDRGVIRDSQNGFTKCKSCLNW